MQSPTTVDNSKTTQQTTTTNNTNETSQKNNSENRFEWQKVEKRKQQKREINTVVGIRASTTTTFLKPMKISPSKCVVYVGRLDPCTNDDLKNHLDSINVQSTAIIPLSRSIYNKKPKHNEDEINNLIGEDGKNADMTTCSAYRITFFKNDYEKVMSPENWPENTIIRDWCFNWSSNVQSDQQNNNHS